MDTEQIGVAIHGNFIDAVVVVSPRPSNRYKSVMVTVTIDRQLLHELYLWIDENSSAETLSLAVQSWLNNSATRRSLGLNPEAVIQVEVMGSVSRIY
jgi:hypothetical protein